MGCLGDPWHVSMPASMPPPQGSAQLPDWALCHSAVKGARREAAAGQAGARAGCGAASWLKAACVPVNSLAQVLGAACTVAAQARHSAADWVQVQAPPRLACVVSLHHTQLAVRWECYSKSSVAQQRGGWTGCLLGYVQALIPCELAAPLGCLPACLPAGHGSAPGPDYAASYPQGCPLPWPTRKRSPVVVAEAHPGRCRRIGVAAAQRQRSAPLGVVIAAAAQTGAQHRCAHRCAARCKHTLPRNHAWRLPRAQRAGWRQDAPGQAAAAVAAVLTISRM